MVLEWKGRATIAAVPTVANAVTIIGLSKKKIGPNRLPVRRPSKIRIKLNF